MSPVRVVQISAPQSVERYSAALHALHLGASSGGEVEPAEPTFLGEQGVNPVSHEEYRREIYE